ncbi:MAG: hypothetical protein PHI89_02980 [Thiovulaceae bacterium]|jgi:hypothetical protein|nr:hypothetical protein [Sulfurimonadaceae bacterium]MDD3817029.1 hypothetical protein [Sulfurimonadaceae bacterium]
MQNKNYLSSQGAIDLTKLTRLYPAVVVDMHGERAEMSLEWAELYGDKVTLCAYVLVFDFTPPKEEKKERIVLEFATKEALMNEMQEVAKFFHA